jgi:hypothetical protein
MDRILDQLAALRKGMGPGTSAGAALDESGTNGMPGAPGAAGVRAGRTSRRAPNRIEKTATSTAHAADPNEVSVEIQETREAAPARTPRPGAGYGGTAAGAPAPAKVPPRSHRSSMSPEKRAMLEKMNRDLEDHIRALRAEHRAAVEKLLGEEGAGAYEEELKRHPGSTGAVAPPPGSSNAATGTAGGNNAFNHNLPTPPPAGR